MNELRGRQMRNLLATLLLSQGTPMLLAGDEFARTQRGNNNAYCQDNEISWVDWTLAEANLRQVRFVQSLTALRRRYPILRRNRFLSTIVNEAIGVKEVTWINASGAEMREEDWTDADAVLRHAARRPRASHRHQATRPGRDDAPDRELATTIPCRSRCRQPATTVRALAGSCCSTRSSPSPRIRAITSTVRVTSTPWLRARCCC